VASRLHRLRLADPADQLLEQLRALSFSLKLIPLTIIKALEDLPLPVYGRGQNVRDWLFVEDHAEALLEIVRVGRAGEVKISGDSERRNLNGGAT